MLACNSNPLPQDWDQITTTKGREPGLVVMEGDSRSEGHVFESQHRFLIYKKLMFGVKNVIFTVSINAKRGRDGPFLTCNHHGFHFSFPLFNLKSFTRLLLIIFRTFCRNLSNH